MRYLILPDKFPIEGKITEIKKVEIKERCSFCGETHIRSELQVTFAEGRAVALTRHQTMVLDTPDNSE